MKFIAWALVSLVLMCGCGKSAKELYREAIDDLNREAELLSRLEKERDDLKKKNADALKEMDDQYAKVKGLLELGRQAAGSVQDEKLQKSIDEYEAEIKDYDESRAKIVAGYEKALGAAQKKVDDQAAIVREASKRRDDAKAAAE